MAYNGLTGSDLRIISHSIRLFIFGMETLNFRELIIYPYLDSRLVKEMVLKI